MALFLSAIYLAITVGIPISIHHCHGQNEISVSIIDEAQCSCSTDVMDKTCCSIETEVLNPCHQNHHESGCCTHEVKVVLWDYDQQLTQKEEFKLQIIELDLFDSQLLFESEFR